MRDSDDWIQELRSGGDAQSSALEDLRDLLIRGLRRSLSGRAGADDGFLEDTAQEAAIRVLDKLDTFKGRSKFTTWAMAIAIRLAISELRRRHWKDISLDAASEEGALRPELALDPHPSPGRQAEQREMVAALSRHIREALTERQRLAIQAEMTGMPLEEIARRLGSNLNAVYKLTHDARRRLRASLEAEGFSLEDVAAAFS